MDFINWKDWEDDSDEDLSSFDKFSEVNSMLNTVPNSECMYVCVCLYML